MASIRIKNEMSGTRYFSKTKFNREKKICKILTNCKFRKENLSCTISHLSVCVTNSIKLKLHL